MRPVYRSRCYNWNRNYAHTEYGQPVALVVPPTANLQTNYGWGVASSRISRIEHQFQRNFPGFGQFGGAVIREIVNGKLGAMVRDAAYQSRTPDFWASCDGIGGSATYKLWGTSADGKGEPGQTNAVSHGCPPARFRNITVLNTATD